MARDPSDRSRQSSRPDRYTGASKGTGQDVDPWRTVAPRTSSTSSVPSTRGPGKKPPKNQSVLRKWFDRVPRWAKWSVAGLVGLIVLSMILDASIFYNKVHAGISIEGQSVSGLTRDAAVQKIQQFVDDSQNSPVTLVAGETTWEVMPDDVGTHIDVEGAVDAALAISREGNVFSDMANKLTLYFSSRDVPLKGSVDSTQLDTLIQGLAEELDVPAVDAGVVVRAGMVVTVREKEGLVVDQEALSQQLSDIMVSLHSTEIQVPMTVDKPDIVTADNQAAINQARTMISTPLTLTWGEKSWTFTPTELSSYVEFTPATEGGPSSMKPYLSAEKMAAKFETIGAETSVSDPIDASFKVVDGKVEVVPGVEGIELDPTKTAEALTAAALKTTERSAEVQGTKQDPGFTTAQAEALGITDLLATYTDKYVGSKNRQTNVALTTKYILQDGNQFLAPGEEFDFKEEVGPRTPERGYVKAPGISSGMVLEDQYGGGICEVSTAVFNAAFRAGLKITERRNHTIYFSHYPKGMDATVSDPGPNLRFVNNTGHYIWITGESDGKTTTIEIYGTSDGRKVSWEVGKWYGVWGPYTQTTLDSSLRTGVSIEIYPGEKAKMCMLYRTIVWPDGKSLKENFESNYKHQFRIVKVGTGTTTPPATTSP